MSEADPRTPLLNLLHRYHPLDEGDQLQLTQIISFVSLNASCFERTNVAGHITGSAWVVDAAGDYVLLTHHKKLDKWLQMGGHADGNPDILAVALREAKEESGLTNLRALSNEIFDVDAHLIPERKNEPAHIHYDIRFLLEADKAEKLIVSHESHDLAWISMDDLSSLTTEASIHRMNRKYVIASPPCPPRRAGTGVSKQSNL